MKRKTLRQQSFVGGMFDVWSVPHFFFGVVAAIWAVVFGMGFLETWGAILCLALFWEWFETNLGVRETWRNRFGDCLLPLLAFSGTYPLFEMVPFAHGDRSAVLVAAILIFFLMNYISWEARLNGEREFLG